MNEMHETGIRKFSGLTCRIQMHKLLGHQWMQRHVWYDEGAAPKFEDWIPSPLKANRKPNPTFSRVDSFTID